MLKSSLHDARRLQECADELYIRGFSRGAETIERFLPDLLNYMSAPFEHWTRIRTTNLLERVNKELKRRSRVIGAFQMIAPSFVSPVLSSWISMKSGSRVVDIYLFRARYLLWIQDPKLQLIRYTALLLEIEKIKKIRLAVGKIVITELTKKQKSILSALGPSA